MYDLPPSSLSWEEIEREAAKISEDFGFDSQARSVRDLAEKIGGAGAIEILSPEEIEHLDSGSLKVSQPGRFKIQLSPITSRVRDNFTIAHELGHYFLHSGTPPGSQPISVGRFGTSIVEQQANRFAAALLMPRERFKEAFKECDGDVILLAGLFKVSKPAAEIRARSLGLI